MAAVTFVLKGWVTGSRAHGILWPTCIFKQIFEPFIGFNHHTQALGFVGPEIGAEYQSSPHIIPFYFSIFFILASVVLNDSRRNVECCMITSFCLSPQWKGEIQEFCPNTKMLLVGCKSDLRTDLSTLVELSNHRQTPVSYDQV